MALDFPSSPTDGQVYNNFIWDAAKGVWKSKNIAGTVASVSATVPTSANNGDMWFNSTTGVTYVYYNDGTSSQWVETVTTAALMNSIDDALDVVITSPSDGNLLKYDGATSKWINSSDTSVVQLNKQTISTNYTMPSGYNGVSAGPITIANGITVTIPDGSAWSVV